MKRMVLVLVGTFIFAQVGFAGSPVQKLGRGAENLMSFPYEYANAYYLGEQYGGGVVAGITRSFVVGTLSSAKRILSGFYDIVTFPVNFPSEYKPIFKGTETSSKSTYEAMHRYQ